MDTQQPQLVAKGDLTKRSIELNKEWYSISNRLKVCVRYLEEHPHENHANMEHGAQCMIEALEIIRQELDRTDFMIQDEDTLATYTSAKKAFKIFRKTLKLFNQWIDGQ